MASTAFENFIAPAKARPALWRLVLGIALGTAVYVGLILGLVGLAAWLAGGETALAHLETGDYLVAPGPTLLMLLSFAGMVAGVVAAARVLHRRGPGTLIGPVRRAVRDFGIAVLVTLAVYLPGVAIWMQVFQPELNMDRSTWFALLPLTVGALLIQTLAEEMVFRGYLMQQLAARFRHWAIWFAGPALIFGAIHYDPSMGGDNALLLIVSPFVFGVLAAGLTVRTGTLGAGWGFHFANNLIAVGLLSTKGTITGLALYLTPYSASEMGDIGPLLASDLALMLVAWLILRRVFRRVG